MIPEFWDFFVKGTIPITLPDFYTDFYASFPYHLYCTIFCFWRVSSASWNNYLEVDGTVRAWKQNGNANSSLRVGWLKMEVIRMPDRKLVCVVIPSEFLLSTIQQLAVLDKISKLFPVLLPVSFKLGAAEDIPYLYFRKDNVLTFHHLSHVFFALPIPLFQGY